MEQVAEAIPMQKSVSIVSLQNFAALGLALIIDFSDVIPGELLFLIGLEPIWVPYDAAISAIEAAYLAYLGVPAVKWLAMSGTDLLPIIDIIPWCTLAVLDRRFHIRIPLITKLFNYS